MAVINGRMSPRSLGRYRKLGWLAGRRLAQARSCRRADRGIRQAISRPWGASKVHVTGSVKYDGANGDRDNPRTVHLRELFGVQAGNLVWIAGSTQAPEEEIVLDILSTGVSRRIPTCVCSWCRGKRTASRRSPAFCSGAACPLSAAAR